MPGNALHFPDAPELVLDDRYAHTPEREELDRACAWQRRLRLKRAAATRLGLERKEGRGAMR